MSTSELLCDQHASAWLEDPLANDTLNGVFDTHSNQNFEIDVHVCVCRGVWFGLILLPALSQCQPWCILHVLFTGQYRKSIFYVCACVCVCVCVCVLVCVCVCTCILCSNLQS